MVDWSNIKDNAYSGKNKEENRRRHPRKKYTTGVTYHVVATPKGTGLLQDLSEGGAGLAIDQYLPVGTLIKITFVLKQETEEIPITATAKVAWCVGGEGGHRVGVQFIE